MASSRLRKEESSLRVRLRDKLRLSPSPSRESGQSTENAQRHAEARPMAGLARRSDERGRDQKASNVDHSDTHAGIQLSSDDEAPKESLWARAWTALKSEKGQAGYARVLKSQYAETNVAYTLMNIQLSVIETNFEGLENRRTIAEDIAKLVEIKKAKVYPEYASPESKLKSAVTRSARLIVSTKDLVMGLSNLDPHGVAPLVLGGIYTLVQIIQNDSEDRRTALALTINLSATVALWNSIEKYQILHNRNPRLHDLYDDLSTAIVDLYKCTIVLLATLIAYFDKGRWAQFLAAATPASTDWTRLHAELESIEANCDRIKSNIDVVTEKEDRDSEILKWISAHDIRGSYRTVLERTKMNNQYSARCQWLIDCPEFRQWRAEGRNSVFWLNGTIGTGKTTLMARAIREVESSFPVEVEGLPLALFFFQKATDGSTELLSVQTCLQSLARQLSWSNATAQVQSAAARKFNDLKVKHQEDGQMTTGDCLDLLKTLILQHETFIMIDGIDECKNSYELLLQLASLRNLVMKQTDGAKALHLMLCGRSDLPVTDCFGDSVLVVANHERSSTDQDFFIDSEIDTICELQAGSLFCSPGKDYPQRLREILKKQGGGLFRWIEIQLQKFSTPGYFRTRDQIQTELKRLETSTAGDELRNEYTRLLTQLDAYEKNRQRALKMLRLISCSFEQLQAVDLAEAMNAEECNQDDDELDADDVRRLLVGFTTEIDRGLPDFLAIEDAELRPTRWPPIRVTQMRVVVLAHASVLEYLVDETAQIEDFTLADRHYQAVLANLARIRAVERCHANEEWTFDGVPADDPSHFLLYSCLSWPEHCKIALRETTGNDSVAVDKLAEFFCNGGFKAWNIWLTWFYGEANDSVIWEMCRYTTAVWDVEELLTSPKRPMPGFVIALYDMTKLLKVDRLRDQIDLQQPNSDGQSLIPRLSSLTHETVNRLMKLFAHQLTPVRDEIFVAAARLYHASLVEGLLDAGQNIESFDRLWGTALWAAVKRCHSSETNHFVEARQTIQLLLARGADIFGDHGKRDCAPTFHTSLMHLAVSPGRKRPGFILELLLDRAIQLECSGLRGSVQRALRERDQKGRTPAEFAAHDAAQKLKAELDEAVIRDGEIMYDTP